MTDLNFSPSVYGRYILLHKIAMGGMAEVFRAKSFGAQDFEKLLAIKRLYPHLSEDPSFVQMFINEARLAATLNHVNVAPIYDFGCQEGLYYIAMEYVRGCDLADLIVRCRSRRQQMPLGLAIWLLVEICNGLDYAHRKHDDLGHFLNLIHRDVTPQNILISYEGEVKITDFGIAKVHMLDRDETTGGLLKGKFSYMSPEQVRGDRLDHRSDIFSLGIMAWELLTYQKMFEGSNDYHILEKVREVQFLPARQVNPNLPPDIDTILSKALTRYPEDRYQSVGQLRLELLRFLSHARLFPSRTHLSAFVRKLFEDKLFRESEDLVEETSLARRIWGTYREDIEKSASLGETFHVSPEMLSFPQTGRRERVAKQASPEIPTHLRPSVAEEMSLSGQFYVSQQELRGSEPSRVSGWAAPSWSGELRPQFGVQTPHVVPPSVSGSFVPPHPSNQYIAPQRPLAFASSGQPSHLQPALPDEWEKDDPTYPDILAVREETPNVVPPPLPAGIRPPQATPPVTSVPRPGFPAPLKFSPQGQVGQAFPATTSPSVAKTNWDEEDDWELQRQVYPRHLSWVVGLSTFVVGLVLVYFLIQWFSPNRPTSPGELSIKRPPSTNVSSPPQPRP